LIDKTLLFHGETIWGLFWLVKKYFAIFCVENWWLAMRLEEGGGSVAALLRNHPIFWSSHPPRERNPDKPPRHVFFDEALCYA